MVKIAVRMNAEAVGSDEFQLDRALGGPGFAFLLNDRCCANRAIGLDDDAL